MDIDYHHDDTEVADEREPRGDGDASQTESFSGSSRANLKESNQGRPSGVVQDYGDVDIPDIDTLDEILANSSHYYNGSLDNDGELLSALVSLSPESSNLEEEGIVNATKNATEGDAAKGNMTAQTLVRRLNCKLRSNSTQANRQSQVNGEITVVNSTDVKETENTSVGEDNRIQDDDKAFNNLSYAKVNLMKGHEFLQFLTDKSDSNITNRTTPGLCSFIYFYATWCPFSAKAAPAFNALAGLHTDIAMIGVDTGKAHGINSQFGVMALPSLILFHNSKPLMKFNGSSFNLKDFSTFLTLSTGLEAEGELTIDEEATIGPIPTKAVPETDYILYFSWIFTILCGIWMFAKSIFCRRIFESIRNVWREVEIQHEHQD